MRAALTQADYRRLLGTDLGLQAMAELMEWAGFKKNEFQPEARWTERLAGREDAVVFLLEKAGILGGDEIDLARALFSIPAREPQPLQEEAEAEP